jgi:hypothetical protein
MARFRRLCVDVEDDGLVVGCSVEFHPEFPPGFEAVWVGAPDDYAGCTIAEVLEDLSHRGWHQPTLPFGGRGPGDGELPLLASRRSRLLR